MNKQMNGGTINLGKSFPCRLWLLHQWNERIQTKDPMINLWFDDMANSNLTPHQKMVSISDFNQVFLIES